MLSKIFIDIFHRGGLLANTKDEYGNQLPEDQWTIVAIPPCIEEFLFSLAQQKRKIRAGKVSEGNYIYILSHKLIDVSVPEQKKFYGIPRTKGGHSYRRGQYTAKDGQYYSVFEISANMIEEEIWNKLKFAMTNTEEFIKRHLSLEKFSKTYIENLQEELMALRENLMNTELESARIEKAYEKGVYSIEKMNEKMMEATKKQTKMQDKIQHIEDELQMISFKDVEIGGLRKAAEQLKYNLNKFSRKQKKMLIDVCIDRIEIDRKEIPCDRIQKKWHRTLTVHFRFNPDRISRELGDSRTRKPHIKAQNLNSNSKNVLSGGQGGGTCTFFKCRYYVGNKLELNKNKVLYKTILYEQT